MNQEAQVALVTGSSDGVGKEVARLLGAEGFHVILHERNAEKTGAVRSELERDVGNQFSTVIADLSSLADVRLMADEINDGYPRLDLLINNAGIGIADGVRQESKDGFELRFAVNYLSHFLLTHLLLQKIKASAPARIVNVSSAGQSAIDFSDVMLEKRYSGYQAYCQSKLAQVMFTFDLAEHLRDSDVTVTALHPATFMNTKMVDTPMSTVEDGARAILNLAVGVQTKGVTGEYCKRAQILKHTMKPPDESSKALAKG